ncbi:hypothetical protein SAMN05216431_10896 [Ligilactobacillus sp. WC1T17]|uniref:Uncharacterized protein n=1 Tax=Ligilactobacillus ruminis TaxID=1623 RepID=A0ABY1ACD3_9LACO|nr:hypothetical protein SAMN05216431_10896 [Ligilactobacillus ruminis]
MRKLNFKALMVGIGLFLMALLFGGIIIFRLTHRGHLGLGPVRTGKLAFLTMAALAGACYYFKQV